jgi:hypothetical protein
MERNRSGGSAERTQMTQCGRPQLETVGMVGTALDLRGQGAAMRHVFMDFVGCAAFDKLP